MSTTLKPVALAAAVLLFAGCDEWGEWGSSDRFKEDFHYTHPLKPGGRVSLENMNGSIEVVGWEKDEVDISGTKYASTEQVMKAMKIDVIASGDAVRIRTVPPSGYKSNHGARYVLRVPSRVQLERIESSNGGIRMESVEGAARVRTSNGAIRTFRMKGPLEATTSNGPVELNGQLGSTIVRTSNGGIRADDVRGAFEATTSNGGITARLADPEPQRPIKLESSNGSINLTLERLNNNDIRVSTSNSSITVRLPGNVQANLRAQTSNSSVNTDFDVTVRSGKLSKAHVEGTIGGGGPTIDLSSSNGGIKILKL
jgi:hypothetical protein